MGSDSYVLPPQPAPDSLGAVSQSLGSGLWVPGLMGSFLHWVGNYDSLCGMRYTTTYETKARSAVVLHAQN